MASSFSYTRTDTLLDIQNVSLSFKGKPILKNLTASIKDVVRPGFTQGQIVALLGPSGIGKTTFFNVVSGLIKPDTGTVTVGKNAQPVEAGKVGVVAQNYPLIDHRTVMGNLVYAGKRAGHTASEAVKIAKDKLNEFGLNEHADKYPIQLSGGQRQRIAVAQQLICSEHYLIMDEPFSGLDVVALAKVRTLILNLAAQNEENTFIIVTHDVTTAVSIADTIWLMGRDRNAAGEVIPGARIMEIIDLIEQDICWHPEPENRVAATDLIHNIKQQFLIL